MKILIEAGGSLVSGYLIKAIKESGHIAVASDINEDNHSVCLADEFIVFPKKNDPYLWDKVELELLKHRIDMVIPSFDETLIGWSKRKEYFQQKGIFILISNVDVLEIFLDKYNAYKFCEANGILTPKTSLKQDYLLIKPRYGRGGHGIYIGNELKNMNGMISQEFIEGIEYTVDCLFDKNGVPIYIVPRKRIDVIDGKSTKGIVVRHNLIVECVQKISKNIKFEGPVNFQFIEKKDKQLYFLEVNPRIAGGMALGFAASENWINVIVDVFIKNNKIKPKPINYGLKMMRYYAECFI